MRRVADQEMAGHPDTDERDTAATSDLYEEDGDRDRNTQAPIEHLVEVRVPGVVVRAVIPPNTQRLEHEHTNCVDVGLSQLGREGIEPVQLRRHIESGVGMGRDQQRSLIERNVNLPTCHEFSPSRRGLHGTRLYKGQWGLLRSHEDPKNQGLSSSNARCVPNGTQRNRPLE